MFTSMAAAAGLYFAGVEGVRLMEHKVGTETASDMFPDGRIANLARAACEGDAQQVAQLIKQGADVNGQGLDGLTVLMWALSCENSAGIEALLKAGSNPNLRSRTGITAVYAAATNRNPDYLRLILKYGGDPNGAPDKDGDTAVWAAMGRGFDNDQWDNYHALLNAGLDINKPARGSSSIADIAMTFRQPGLVVDLIDRGFKFDPEKLAFQIYQSAFEDEGNRHQDLRKLIEIVKSRGVDVEMIKRKIVEQDKKFGVDVHRDFSFEIEPLGNLQEKINK